MTTSRRCACGALAVLFLLPFPAPLRSQTSPKAPPAKAAKPTVPAVAQPGPDTLKTAPKEIFKVTINASRVSVTRDASYGVYADLENISSDVVKVRPQETVLVVQPEIAQPTACVGLEPGIFPAQPLPADKTQPDGIMIQPAEHYKVFWELTRDFSAPKERQLACSYHWAKFIDEYLGFVPGEYAFTVEGVVYAPNAKGETVPHTYTETTTLHVGLSQASTALAAFIGALLAYFVVALQPGRDFDQWKMKTESTAAASLVPSTPLQITGGWLRSAAIVLRNALAAGLLGAALTIVASRLSDTQFPVKVSVNDFWGALTIGFISYFIGGRLLASIIDRFAPPSKNPPTGAADAGGPAVGNSGTGNPPQQDEPAHLAAENLIAEVPEPANVKYQEFSFDQEAKT